MRIHHQILMKLLAKRIADKRFLNLIERFLNSAVTHADTGSACPALKAGIMEGRLFKRTELGTPQGAICSPRNFIPSTSSMWVRSSAQRTYISTS